MSKVKYITHRERKTTKGNMRKLWDKLSSLGFRGFTLRWEPTLEMCDHSGGYILTEQPNDMITQLGFSLKEALKMAQHHAEYIKQFHPKRYPEMM